MERIGISRAQSAPELGPALTAKEVEDYYFGEQLKDTESHTIEFKSCSKAVRNKDGSLKDVLPGRAEHALEIFKVSYPKPS